MNIKTLETQKIFLLSLKLIINILIIYIIIILGIGLIKTLFEIKTLLKGGPIDIGFAQVVTDILTFLVIIELFKGFIEYFKTNRFRLHSMIEPSIVFVVRELIVNLYKHGNLSWLNLMGFGILILSLGLVRTLAVCFSPSEEESTTIPH